MTDPAVKIQKISSMINEHLSRGLKPDNDTISFMKSGYGLNTADEIISFIEEGDDTWSLIEMLSYPPDSFRESAEEFIPYEGFSMEDIKTIEELFTSAPLKIFILFNDRKIYFSDTDSFTCFKRFLQRLNLNTNLNRLSDISTSEGTNIIYAVKACLRKIRFNTTDENFLFLSDLTLNYKSVKNSSDDEFKVLINTSAGMLNCSTKKAMDILAEKKYFYENAVSESEEFARMLKTYSMEFIMLKRIQPPLIHAEEARSMIRLIDRLTSIVYGMIIPSVQNIFPDS